MNENNQNFGLIAAHLVNSMIAEEKRSWEYIENENIYRNSFCAFFGAMVFAIGITGIIFVLVFFLQKIF